MRLVAFSAIVMLVSNFAHAANIAATSTIINFSNNYPLTGYEVGNVIDGQTVDNTQQGNTANDVLPDGVNVGSSSYWGAINQTSAFFTLDLGASYSIDQFRIANTRNNIYGDFGSQTFNIFASNTIDGGNNLTSPTTLISSGSLTQPASPVAIPFDVFNPTGSSFGTFRYVQFEGLRAAAGGRVGLNEFQVIHVPEPASLSVLALGLLSMVRRRRSVR